MKKNLNLHELQKFALSLDELQKFADVLGTRVISRMDEILHPLHHSMHDWCNKHNEVIVLENGDILCSDPTSSVIHECQRHLDHHGFKVGSIYPTTVDVINLFKKETIKKKNKQNGEVISDSHHQLRSLIYSAVKSKASDVHITIMPDIGKSIIHFRVNGILQLHAQWTAELGIKLHSVAYNHLSSNKQDAFSMILPQDMSFTESFPKLGDIRIRSSNIGIKNGGCKITYRLLSVGQEDTPSIDQLGYAPDQLGLLHEIPDIGSGIVLFCGETGSGKTTSLASIMTSIDHRKCAYSIEDPVEKYISNVNQCPIDTRSDKLNFAHYLRALLRADPDVIMVGEIRDSDTAKVAIQGALTGHLIISTLHTRYAVNAIVRLHEQGVPANHLATPGLLKMIVAQQLYPEICSKCSRKLNEKEKYNITDKFKKSEINNLRTVDYNLSCSHCRGTGIGGRKVYAEVIKIDRISRDYIRKMDIRGWEEYLHANGFINLTQRVRQDVVNGKIDVFAPKALEPPEIECVNYSKTRGATR